MSELVDGALPLQQYPERTPAPNTGLRWLRSRLARLLHMGLSLWPDTGLNRFERLVEHARAEARSESAAPGHAIAAARDAVVRGGWTVDRIDALLAGVVVAADRALQARCGPDQAACARHLLRGRVVEIAPRSKAVAAVGIAAATSALAGRRVHVVSASTPLAAADHGAVKPLFDALGITTSCITAGASADERRVAYRASVVYVTAYEVGGDYLSDRDEAGRSGSASALQLKLGRLVGGRRPAVRRLPGLPSALVLDADHVLLDAAVAPRLLRGEAPSAFDGQWARKAAQLARGLDKDVDFVVDESARSIELTETGKEGLRARAADAQDPWRNKARREDAVRKALLALHVYARGRDYVVEDGRVVARRSSAGSAFHERRDWDEGVRQVIEILESCPVSPGLVVRQRITYQNLFRRYHALAGTSTALGEAASELWSAYELRSQTVSRARFTTKCAARTVVTTTRAEQAELAAAACKRLVTTALPVVIAARNTRTATQIRNSVEAAGVAVSVAPDAATRAGPAPSTNADAPVQIVLTSFPVKALAEGPQLFDSEQEFHLLLIELPGPRRLDRQLIARLGGRAVSMLSVLSLEDPVLAARPAPFLVRRLLGDTMPGRIVAKRLCLASRRRLEILQRAARRDVLDVERRHRSLLAFSGGDE